MYAVIESGGKQYRLSQGDVVDLERLGGEVGDEVVFDEVLLLNDGDEAVVGDPMVSGARVVGEIVEQKKAGKIVVFKFKRRKMYRRKRGHRQLQTRVLIKEIEEGGSSRGTSSSSAKQTSESSPAETAASTAKTEEKPKAGATRKKASASRKETSEKSESND